MECKGKMKCVSTAADALAWQGLFSSLPVFSESFTEVTFGFSFGFSYVLLFAFFAFSHISQVIWKASKEIKNTLVLSLQNAFLALITEYVRFRFSLRNFEEF